MGNALNHAGKLNQVRPTSFLAHRFGQWAGTGGPPTQCWRFGAGLVGPELVGQLAGKHLRPLYVQYIYIHYIYIYIIYIYIYYYVFLMEHMILVSCRFF